MSQAGIINVIENNPNIPTQFDANVGVAIPLANILNIIGTGVVSTTGSGNTITIMVSGGGISWTDVTGTSQAMAVNNGYIADNGSLVTLTLPTTAAIGDTVIVQGKGSGGWKITYTTNQQINLGSSASTVTTGNIASTNQWDSVTLTCVTANNIWAARAVQGNITVV